MTTLNELEALAKAATPGPWIGAGPSFGKSLPLFIDEVIIDHPDEEDDGYTICMAPTTERESATAEMNYIAAANPDTILQMIALIRQQHTPLRYMHKLKSDNDPTYAGSSLESDVKKALNALKEFDQ